MSTQLLAAVLSGAFSLTAAFGSIFLKDYLDRRRERRADTAARTSALQSDPRVQEQTHRSLTWMRPLLLTFGAFALGSVDIALRDSLTVNHVHYGALISLGLLLLTSVFLILSHRSSLSAHYQLRFQLELLALWAGYFSGWSVGNKAVWDDVIVVCLGWWIGSAFAGGIILRLTRFKIGVRHRSS
jgi:hypothetical protein